MRTTFTLAVAAVSALSGVQASAKVAYGGSQEKMIRRRLVKRGEVPAVGHAILLTVPNATEPEAPVVAAPVANVTVPVANVTAPVTNATEVVANATVPAVEWHNGTALWFAETGERSACYTIHNDDDLVVGLPTQFYPKTGAISDLCGQYLFIRTSSGSNLTALISDASGKDYTTLTKAAFRKLAPLQQGMIDIEYTFLGKSNDTTTLLSPPSIEAPVANSTSVASAVATGSKIVALAPAPVTTTTEASAAPSLSTTDAPVTTTTTQRQTTVAPTTTTTEFDSASFSSSSRAAASRSAAAASSAQSQADAQQEAEEEAARSSSRAAAAAASSRAAADAAASQQAEAQASSSRAAAAASSRAAAQAAEASQQAAAAQASQQAAAAQASQQAAAAQASQQAAAAKASQEAAAAQASQKAQAQQNSGGGGGGGKVYTGGFATYFYQNGNAGNCGQVNPDSAKLIALDTRMYDGGSHCGKSITLRRTDNGKSVTAFADSCPTCVSATSLDLSVGAFTAIATFDEGMVPIEWWWA